MSHLRLPTLLIFAAAVSLSACTKEKEAETTGTVVPKVEKGERFVSPVPAERPVTGPVVADALSDGAIVENPKPSMTNDGVQIIDIVIGGGPQVRFGDKLVLHYVGLLEDKRMFDNSRKRGSPMEIEFGVSKIIPGFRSGLATMREGGRRRILMPPNLAYGKVGLPNGLIPPNAWLLFEVDMLSVKPGPKSAQDYLDPKDVAVAKPSAKAKK